MQKGHHLHFPCIECHGDVSFSVFDTENVKCKSCGKDYLFDDTNLTRQLEKFETLCQAIVDADEILSQTSIGVDVGEKQIQIPYKILLTRMSSMLELKIEGKPVTIAFRMELK